MIKTQAKAPYQVEVDEFARPLEHVGFFVFYGGGKTRASLVWLESKGAAALPCVIVVPSETHIAQWAQEIVKHSSFRYAVVKGSAKQRKEALELDADIYLVNHDCVRSAPVFNALYMKGFNGWIWDESAALANAKSQRFQLWKRITQRITYRAILNGLPITEKTEQLWAQLLMLDDGESLSSSFWTFRRRYFDPPPGFWAPEWTPKLGGAGVDAIAKAISSKCIYVPKKVVIDQLPPKEYNRVYLELPNETRKIYDEFKKNWRVQLPSGRILRTSFAAVAAQKLHQIANGFVILSSEDGDDASSEREVEVVDRTKFDWLAESAQSIIGNGPTLFWSFYKTGLQLIRIALDSAGVGHAVYDGHGETGTSAIRQFVDGDVPSLVISETAGHSGLDLYRAQAAIFVNGSYINRHRQNAEDRCHRWGSEIHNKITYTDVIMRETVDEIVLDAIANKQDATQAMLAAMEKR